MKAYFLGKIKKSIIYLLSAEFAQRVVKVKDSLLFSVYNYYSYKHNATSNISGFDNVTDNWYFRENLWREIWHLDVVLSLVLHVHIYTNHIAFYDLNWNLVLITVFRLNIWIPSFLILLVLVLKAVSRLTDDILYLYNIIIFFIYIILFNFSEKIRLGISCESSSKGRLL